MGRQFKPGQLETGSLFNISSSFALTASYLNNYIPPFPFTGSAQITGSLGVTGSINGLLISRGNGNVATNVSIGATTAFSGSNIGVNNTAIGKYALRYNTTGCNNAAIGYRALYVNSTGNHNVAIGNTSLVNNVTGNANTAIGRRTLYGNTTGCYNVAIGERALPGNTTGNQNVALGLIALYSNTTGANNVAIGTSALFANTTGNDNTAIGCFALFANTTSTGNIAFGYNALRYNTIGCHNIAQGLGAMRCNVSGNYNIALGEQALRNITTGSSNIALGTSAARLNSVSGGITSLSSSIVIGVNAKPSASGDINEIIIGDSAIGLGSNTTVIGNTNTTRACVFGQLTAGGFTGSLFGTASNATQAVSASYLNTLNQDLIFNGNLALNGTASIAYLNVAYESASVIYSSGSNQFGDASNDTQTLWGTVDIKSGPVLVTGSVIANSFTGSLLGTASYAVQALSASFATTASYVSSNFQYEIHVSQVDGNDTTGNGDLLKPVATIGKALLIVSASVASTDRRTIIVHPGTYIENITVNTTNTYFFSTGLLGANCLISGSVTISAATRMSGIKMTNLIVSSSNPIYINNCAVDKQMTVSGSGYLEVQNTSLQCTSGIQVVGPASSGVIFENCSLYPLTVNNASAAVYVISCNQAITPTLTAGALTITRSTISSLTSGATSTALTTAAGSVLVLESCNVYNSLLTSHAAITANGFYSIKNVIYNRSASTLASLSGTGGPLATVSQFQYINADNITTKGLTITGSLTVSGSSTFTNIGPAVFSGSTTITGSLIVTGGITGSLLGTATTASFAVTASYIDGGTF